MIEGKAGRRDGAKKAEEGGMDGGSEIGFAPTNEGVGYSHFQPRPVLYFKSRVFSCHSFDNTIHRCLDVELD